MFISLSSFAQRDHIDFVSPLGNEISLSVHLVETTNDSIIYQFSVVNTSNDTIDIKYSTETMFAMTPDSIFYSLGPTHSEIHYLVYPGQEKVFWEDFSMFKSPPLNETTGDYFLYWNLIFINKASNLRKYQRAGPLPLWSIE